MGRRMVRVIKFKFDEQGVPLVPYIPEPEEQILVAEISEGDAELYQHAVHPAHSDWSDQVQNVSGSTADEILKIAEFAAGICRDWNERAKAKGHQHAYLIWDGGNYYPVYFRRATLDEIVELKEVARLELARSKLALGDEAERMAGARRLLKNELEEGE